MQPTTNERVAIYLHAGAQQVDWTVSGVLLYEMVVRRYSFLNNIDCVGLEGN